MFSKKNIFLPLWAMLFTNVAFSFPVSPTWIAETSDSDLNTSSNWSTGIVPGSGNLGNFDNTISGINLSPTATSTFTIGSLNFVRKASPFTFTFDNCELAFAGSSVGVTGTETNPTLNITNSNQILTTPQLSLTGSINNSLGSSVVTILNHAANQTYDIPYQINCPSTPFSMGDSASLRIENLATAENNSIISRITNAQASFGASFTAGDNVSLSFINSGVCQASTSNVNIGYISGGGPQLSVTGAFNARNSLNLSLQNIGTSESLTNSNTCGYIGTQGVFNSSFITGENATITVSNSGTNDGSGNPYVGNITNDSQFHVSGAFISGDSLNLTLTNSALNTDTATGSNSVGSLSSSQGAFDSTFNTGKNAFLSFSNTGTNNGNNVSANQIGHVSSYQFIIGSDFFANDAFTLTLSNTGNDTGSNSNSNQLGYLGNDQAFFTGVLMCQNNGKITVTNSGSCTGTSVSSSIGYEGDNQFTASSYVSLGHDFNLSVTNTGTFSGSGDNNLVGYISNNQLYFSGPVFAGDHSSISVSNTGVSSNGTGNQVGCIGRFPFQANGAFSTGDYFNLTVTNSGINTSSGTGNYVGTLLNGYQIYFGSTLTVGNNATIAAINSATYAGTDTTSFVGSMEDQIVLSSPFIAGENLTLSATNTVVNPHNVVGIGNIINQIDFMNSCTLSDGTLISAVNSGSINTQIGFNAGFTLNGKATFEAINTGTLSGTGISITNAEGGDINIVLQNSSLVVDNSGILAPFTLGALNGDTTSTVTCAQGLIIDTDAGVNAVFAGKINSMPALVKNGEGTQTFSGIVDPTDTSTINEGVLNLTGSFLGDIDVGLVGTLTGSGVITGVVINNGSIEPTNTLTITEFINTNTGTYDASVSSSQNYAIDSTTDTVLSGGSLFVSSIDGTYLFYYPYTVLTSGSSITGTFSSISAASPLITPFVTYSDTEVFVTLKQNLSAAAFSTNEKNVATVLDLVERPTLKQSLLISQIVNLSIEEAEDTLDSLSGKQYAEEAFFIETVNRQFIRRMYDPIRSQVTCNSCTADCCDDLTLWSEVGGDFTSIHGNHLNGYQLTAGAQKGLCPDWTLGAAISYEGDYIDYSHTGGSQYANNGLVGIYSLYRPSNYYLVTDLAYGYTTGTMDRKIHIGSSTYKAKSHPKNSELTFYSEFGGDWNIRKLLIQPFAGIEVDGSWKNDISESGSNGWLLNIKGKNHCDVYSRAGAHLTSCKMPKGFLLSLDLAWDYRFTSFENNIEAEFTDFEGDFKVYGTHLNRSSFEYGFTLLNEISSHWEVYVETTGQIWNRATTFTALAGFSFSW